MTKKETIEHLITKYEKQYREYFNTLNGMPEKSMAEHKTTEFISKSLAALGLKHQHFGPKVGLWGEVNFKGAKKTIAWRADIDALPVGDGTYAHRCGHSSHSSGMLAALHIIVKEKIQLPFNIRFIFQPGEETGDGALLSLKEKAYDGVEKVLAAHSFKNKKNEIIVSHGLTLSGVGYGRVKIYGPGGHSSKSNEIANPLIELIEIMNNIQKDLDAFDMPNKHCSFCISQLHGGIKGNMIPEEVWAEFCFRYYDDEIQKAFWEIVKKHTDVKLKDLKIEVLNDLLNPPVINVEEPVQMILDSIKDTTIVTDEVQDLQETFSEDLAFVFEKYPGALVFVGIQDKVDLDGLHKVKYKPENGEPMSLLRFWLAVAVHHQV